MKDTQILNAINNKLGANVLTVKRIDGAWVCQIDTPDQLIHAEKESFREAIEAIGMWLKQS